MRPGRNLRKVAKGGVLFSVGSFGSTLLHFVTGIIVIRMITRSDYGLIALGTTVVTMLSLLSMLGFKTAVPRFLAKYRAQGEKGPVRRSGRDGIGLRSGSKCHVRGAVVRPGSVRRARL